MRSSVQVLIVGGGINGAGVAREATARGFSTMLIEKNDFGHATSGNSSKLIHGGIRYLEQAEFRLVNESLKERKILLDTAPHLVRPARINIPVYKGDKRPGWMVQLGSKMYDWFAGKDNLTPSRGLSASERQNLPHLRKDGLRAVVQYSDAQTHDSRLVLETALSAKTMGADVLNYVEFIEAQPNANGYLVKLKDHRRDQLFEVQTNYLVNAAGPWVPLLDQHVSQQHLRPGLSYVRGIHFVVHRRFDEGYLILPEDGRVIFVLPWHRNYTLIGTTESKFEGDHFDKIPSSQDEEQYLYKNYNHFFPSSQITSDDVLHVYSGVRSLVETGEKDLSSISREYRLEDEPNGEKGGYLAVFGGKLTSYRALSQKVLDRISERLTPSNASIGNTSTEPLFGAIDHGLTVQQLKELENQCIESGVTHEILDRWQWEYGNRWVQIARYCIENKDNLQPTVHPLFLRAELLYNINDEMARSLEDVTLRRTKWIYELSDIQMNELDAIISQLLPDHGIQAN